MADHRLSKFQAAAESLSPYELVSLIGQLDTLFDVATALINAPNLHMPNDSLNTAGKLFEEVYRDVGYLLEACQRQALRLNLSKTENSDRIAKEVVRYTMEDVDCVPLARIALSMAKASFGEEYA